MHTISVRTFDLHKALKVIAPVQVMGYSKDLCNVFLSTDEKQRGVLTNARIKWELFA